MSAPWGIGEADALAESVLVRVCADGMEERPALALVYLLGWKIVELHDRQIEAFSDPKTRTVCLNFKLDRAAFLKQIAHELGHIILYEARVPGPHDEDFVDEVGRSGVIGRIGMLWRLKEMSNSAEVVESYLHLLPAPDVARRIWEVRRALMRKIG